MGRPGEEGNQGMPAAGKPHVSLGQGSRGFQLLCFCCSPTEGTAACGLFSLERIMTRTPTSRIDVQTCKSWWIIYLGPEAYTSFYFYVFTCLICFPWLQWFTETFSSTKEVSSCTCKIRFGKKLGERWQSTWGRILLLRPSKSAMNLAVRTRRDRKSGCCSLLATKSS